MSTSHVLLINMRGIRVTVRLFGLFIICKTIILLLCTCLHREFCWAEIQSKKAGERIELDTEETSREAIIRLKIRMVDRRRIDDGGHTEKEDAFLQKGVVRLN